MTNKDELMLEMPPCPPSVHDGLKSLGCDPDDIVAYWDRWRVWVLSGQHIGPLDLRAAFGAGFASALRAQEEKARRA